MKTRISQLLSACLALVVLGAAAETRYVDLNSPSPTPPYTNWLTAATNIQDAIDAADAGDLVLVTNGIYQTGGRVVGTSFLTNRVAVTKPLTLQSINGSEGTVIQGFQVPGTTNGDGAVRCAYLTNGAVLSGFTLTNGATRNSGDLYLDRSGGGVHAPPALGASALISNCVLVGNSAAQFGGGACQGRITDCSIAENSAYIGGGVKSATLTRCVLRGNKASSYGGGADGTSFTSLNNCILVQNKAYMGGGAYAYSLNGCLVVSNQANYGGGIYSALSARNCTVTENSAFQGGGIVASGGSIFNCIVFYNSATTDSNLDAGACDSTCTTPMANGQGNITNEPAFIDFAGGNYRLQPDSPCINAGNNAYATITNDLDGNPRISGGTMDIGAYEFQSPASVLSYAWAQQYGFPTDSSADFTDADGDGANNWQEFRADTVPTNATSVLLMGTATNGATGLVVSWASVATRSYWLERATNLSAMPPFKLRATNLPGVAGTKTYNDTSATNSGPYFYRVGVQ